VLVKGHLFFYPRIARIFTDEFIIVVVAERTLEAAPAPSFVVCKFVYVCMRPPGPVRPLPGEAARLHRRRTFALLEEQK